MTIIEAILKNVGHRNEFRRPGLDRQGITCRTCAASAAPDQGHANRVLLGRVDVFRNRDSGQRRRGRDAASCLKNVTTRQAFLMQFAHGQGLPGMVDVRTAGLNAAVGSDSV